MIILIHITYMHILLIKGDADYKPHVTAVPEVREIPLDGGEDFLILACDGLWDFVSEDFAAQVVYQSITEKSGKSIVNIFKFENR